MAQQAPVPDSTDHYIAPEEFFVFSQIGNDVLYTGLISGSGFVSVVGDGTLIMGAAQPFEGEVQVRGGKIKLALDNAFNSTASILLTYDNWGSWSLLDLDGHSLSTRNLVLNGGILKNGRLEEVAGSPSLIFAFEGEIDSIMGGATSRPELRVTVFFDKPETVRLRGQNEFGIVTVDRGAILHLLAGTTTADSLTISRESQFRIGSSNSDATFKGNITNGGTISLTNSAAQDWENIISDGERAGSFTKDGGGELTLRAIQTYTGSTTIAAGSLRLGVDDALNALSEVIVRKDGTFNLNAQKITLRQLTLDGGAVIDGSFTGALISRGGTISSLKGNAEVGLEKNVTTFVGDNDVQSLALLNDATLKQQDVDQTLTVKGNITFNAGGSYIISFNEFSLSRLKVKGDIDLGGAKLVVRGSNISNGFIGGQYIIITSDGVISNNFGRYLVEGMPGFRAKTSIDGHNVILTISSTLVGLDWEIPAGKIKDLGGASQDFDSIVVSGGTLKNGSLQSLQSLPIESQGGFISDIKGGVSIHFISSPSNLISVLSGDNFFDQMVIKNGAVVYVLNETKASSVLIEQGGQLNFGNETQDGLINLDISNGGQLVFNTIADLSWVKQVNDAAGYHGDIEKKGAGKLSFAAVQTYTGSTIISEGMLALGIDYAIDPKSEIIIRKGATLALAGFKQSSDAISLSGGTILGGEGVLGTLGELSGTITAKSGGELIGLYGDANLIILSGQDPARPVLVEMKNGGSLGTVTVNRNTKLTTQGENSEFRFSFLNVADGGLVELLSGSSSARLMTINSGGIVDLKENFLTANSLYLRGEIKNGRLNAAISSDRGILTRIKGASTLLITGTLTAIRDESEFDSITVNGGATLMSDGVTSQVRVKNDVLFLENSSYTVTISPTNSSLLTINGGLDIAKNVSLQVSAEAGTYVGNTYKIITVEGSISGSFASARIFNLPRFSVAVDRNGSDFILTLKSVLAGSHWDIKTGQIAELGGDTLSFDSAVLNGGTLANGGISGNDGAKLISNGGFIDKVRGGVDLLLNPGTDANVPLVTTLTGANVFGDVTIDANTKLVVINTTTTRSVTIRPDGILQLGDGNQNGNVTSVITNDGTVLFKNGQFQQYNGTITGNGSVIKEGRGQLVIFSVQPFKGSMTIRDGEVYLWKDGVFRAESEIILEGGRLNLGGGLARFNSINLSSGHLLGGTMEDGSVIQSRGGKVSEIGGSADLFLLSGSTEFLGENQFKSIIMRDASTTRFTITKDTAPTLSVTSNFTLGGTLIVKGQGGGFVERDYIIGLLSQNGSYNGKFSSEIIEGLNGFSVSTEIIGQRLIMHLTPTGDNLIIWNVIDTKDLGGTENIFDRALLNGGTLTNGSIISRMGSALRSAGGIIKDVSASTVDLDLNYGAHPNQPFTTILSGVNSFRSITVRADSKLIVTGETSASVTVESEGQFVLGGIGDNGVLKGTIASEGHVAFNVQKDSRVKFDGALTGKGDVFKIGDGILTFAQDPQFQGVFFISGGEVDLEQKSLATRNVVVSGGAFLRNTRNLGNIRLRGGNLDAVEARSLFVEQGENFLYGDNSFSTLQIQNGATFHILSSAKIYDIRVEVGGMLKFGSKDGTFNISLRPPVINNGRVLFNVPNAKGQDGNLFDQWMPISFLNEIPGTGQLIFEGYGKFAFNKSATITQDKMVITGYLDSEGKRTGPVIEFTESIYKFDIRAMEIGGVFILRNTQWIQLATTLSDYISADGSPNIAGEIVKLGSGSLTILSENPFTGRLRVTDGTVSLGVKDCPAPFLCTSDLWIH